MVVLQHDLNCPQSDISLHVCQTRLLYIMKTRRKHTMSDTHSAHQSGGCCGVEDISDHPVRLALIETPLRTTCNDTTCVLSAMLEKRETLADLRSSVDRWVMVEEA